MCFNVLRKINTFDNYGLYIVRKYLKNKYLDSVMPIVTSMGNLGLVWIVIAAILIANKPYRLIGYTVILTLIVSTLIGEGIVKHIVRRIRPCDYNGSELLIAKPLTYSFPSGHTLSSFAVAGVLSIYFSEYKLIFVGIAFLIALSRLYLYVHYPTDVIAGVLIGIMCSKLIFIMIQSGYIDKIAILYKSIV